MWLFLAERARKDAPEQPACKACNESLSLRHRLSRFHSGILFWILVFLARHTNKASINGHDYGAYLKNVNVCEKPLHVYGHGYGRFLTLHLPDDCDAYPSDYVCGRVL